MAYPLSPLALPLWRMIRPERQGTPFSGEGARLYGGRWNMKGWPALYLAADHVTAVAEYYRGLPRPGTLVPYWLDAARIADLTRVDDQIADALACDWKVLALIEGKVPASWQIAQQLIADGAEGALVPSTQNRGGRNLVLWRWHDAAGADDVAGGGEGAALTMLDPNASLRR